MMKLLYLFVSLALAKFSWSAEDVCQSTVCQKFSANLQAKSLNPYLDPCDNFFEYICGHYAEHHEPNAKYGWSNSFLTRNDLVKQEVREAFLKTGSNSTSKVVQAASFLYSDCLDEQLLERRGVRPLVDFAENLLGAWPMIRQPKVRETILWPDLLVNVVSRMGLNAIFNIETVLRGSNVKQFAIGRGDISLALAKDGLSNGTSAYREFLHQMVNILGSTQSKVKIAEDIEHLIAFEREIEKITGETRGKGETEFKGSLANLKVATGNLVDWRSVINRILDRLSSTLPRVTPNSWVEVGNLPFVKAVTRLLNTTPLSVIQNFFATAITLQNGPFTTAQMRQAITGFTGSPETSNLTAFCVSLPKLWPHTVWRTYVDQYFPLQEKKEATALVTQIHATFRANLEANSWLDSETRKAAIEKLDAIKQEIGFYPEGILDDSMLAREYPDLAQATLVKGRFLENMIQLSAGFKKKELEHTPPRLQNLTDEQLVAPDLVNAFYNFRDNSIVIPAGILQEPFFDHELPWAINYGAIGAIIGHELTHGFDSEGSQYDKYGVKRNWWSSGTLAKFHAKTSCFEKQYSDLHDPVVNLNISGVRTLAENIADNGGVKMAFGAYQEHLKEKKGASRLPGLHFTSDQLFFVGFANIWCEAITAEKLKAQILANDHAPDRYRVNVVLGNTPSFAEAFNCPIGSKMNPVEKCAVW